MKYILGVAILVSLLCLLRWVVRNRNKRLDQATSKMRVPKPGSSKRILYKIERVE